MLHLKTSRSLRTIAQWNVFLEALKPSGYHEWGIRTSNKRNWLFGHTLLVTTIELDLIVTIMESPQIRLKKTSGKLLYPWPVLLDHYTSPCLGGRIISRSVFNIQLIQILTAFTNIYCIKLTFLHW